MDHTTTNRRPVHLRRIACEGFLRDDGLVDIEGTLIDTKPAPFDLPDKTVPIGEPVHRMTLCLTIDRELMIVAASARTLDAPYEVCGDIVDSYRKLVGLRIEPGFVQRVKRMFRGTLGCTHLSELLPTMATTALQVMWSMHFDGPDPSWKRGGSPLGACHALRLDGPVVLKHFRHLLPQAPDA